jgi:hypothetical protein
MTPTLEQELRRRIAELEEDNAELRSERRILRDIITARMPPGREVTELEYLDMMKNHVPGSGRKFFEELGILPPQSK